MEHHHFAISLPEHPRYAKVFIKTHWWNFRSLAHPGRWQLTIFGEDRDSGSVRQLMPLGWDQTYFGIAPFDLLQTSQPRTCERTRELDCGCLEQA